MRVARLVAATLAASAVLGALSGCGYRPVYGRGGAVQQATEQVRIAALPDRQGQVLRNALLDRMNPNGQPPKARYTLNIGYQEFLELLAVRRDETATRANLRIVTNFTLTESASGLTVLRGISRRTASYNLLQSDYGNLIARRTAQRRAVEQIADDISLRVALYFNRVQRLRQAKQPSAPKSAPKPAPKPAQ